MFSRKSKESPIERLEREANDDFLLLAELGPEYFGAKETIRPSGWLAVSNGSGGVRWACRRAAEFGAAIGART